MPEKKEPEFQFSLGSLDEADLHDVFGAGPSNELGDIGRIVDDKPVVDLSWLDITNTYVPNYSVEPVHKELEDEWIKWDTPYGAFKLTNNTEPIMVQVKKHKLWDHSDVTSGNLYQWAPPTSRDGLDRALSHKNSSINVEQFFKRLLHRGYTGEVFETEARKYMDEPNWNKSASKRESLLKDHEGLMGNVYVDVTAFDSCEEAKKFAAKFNRTARLVVATPHCAGCTHNTNGRCNLLKRNLCASNTISENTANKYIDYLKTVSRIDNDFLNKTASLDNTEKVRAAFLYKKEILPREGGVKASAAPKVEVKSIDEDKYVAVAAKYLAKGVKVANLKDVFTKRIDSNRFDGIVVRAVQTLPVVPADIDECDSPLLKKASKIVRASKCEGCSFDMGTHCRKAGTEFDINIAKPVAPREGGVVADLAPRVKAATRDTQKYVSKVAKAIKAGASYDQLLTASEGKLTQPEFDKVMKEATMQAEFASPDQFNSCDTMAPLNSIKVGNKCDGCIFNEQLRCGKLKKAFLNVAEREVNATEMVADHHLYNSFFKDISMSKVIELNDISTPATLDISGLDEFNL